MTDLILLGAGGHAKDIIKNVEEYNEACRRNERFNIIGCIDDVSEMKKPELMGYRVFGSMDVLSKKAFRNAELICAVGDPGNKIKFIKKVPARKPRFATVIHPSVNIGRSVDIGPGTIIFAGSVISAFCKIGVNVCVNYSCTISHDCVIGDNATIAPGVNLGGRVRVGDNALLGINSCCSNKITLGPWSAVGAGTVVIKDVPGYAIVVGNPHRIIGNRKENLPLI